MTGPAPTESGCAMVVLLGGAIGVLVVFDGYPAPLAVDEVFSGG